MFFFYIKIFNLDVFYKLECDVPLEVAIGRAGPGWAGPGWAGPTVGRAGSKLARFFRANILTAQPALKTGSVGPNSRFKAKKNSSGPGRAGSYRAGPNLDRFFSGQYFNGPARP